MTLTGIRNDNGDLTAVDIFFNCCNCGEPVTMRYNVTLNGQRKQLFLDQAKEELCLCDYNSTYLCLQDGIGKLVEMMAEL